MPNELVKLADMNGDRLADLVKLTVFGRTLEITYWLLVETGLILWKTKKSGVISLVDTILSQICMAFIEPHAQPRRPQPFRQLSHPRLVGLVVA